MGPLCSSSLLVSPLAPGCLHSGGTETCIVWSLSLSRCSHSGQGPGLTTEPPKLDETAKDWLGSWLQAELSVPACSAPFSFIREKVKPAAWPALCPELPLPASTLAPGTCAFTLAHWKTFRGSLSDSLTVTFLLCPQTI